MNKTFNKKIDILETNHILIECEINGILGKFIIDSGASNSCIDYKKSEKFNLEFEISNESASSATNKINKTYISKKNTVKIDNWLVNDFDLILFNMKKIVKTLTSICKVEIDGIIGSDILIKGKAIINFKKYIIQLEL